MQTVFLVESVQFMFKENKLSLNEGDGYSKYYYYKLVIFISAVLAVLMFLPFVIRDQGYFIYYGDFNAQQIPFHKHAVSMVHDGSISWDWYTDLGSNFYGDYSFYLTTSPFFWFMCLFPASWSPYLMAPVYVLKFTVAAICAFAYLKRFVKKPIYAVLGALMYAFSGFQVYNVFFNHFHDSVAFFPLMLLGIEELVQNNRRGLFAFSVFICASVNYFFFAGEAVFCVFYFVFRSASSSFKLTGKKFFWLLAEAVLGVMMSLVFFMPAILSIMGNNRLDRSFSSLKGAFLWTTKGQLYTNRYGHIFQSFFFPPDIPSRPEFFGGSDLGDTLQTHTTRWASNATWVPLFGMSGAFAYMTSRRKSWLSRFIVFLVFCALVPVMNSLFYMGNTSYYARWMYMIVLMLVVATIISLEKTNIKWNKGLVLNAVCCFIIMIPSVVAWKNIDGNWSLTRSTYPERIYISAAIAFICIGISAFISTYLRGRKVSFKYITIALCAAAIIYSFCLKKICGYNIIVTLVMALLLCALILYLSLSQEKKKVVSEKLILALLCIVVLFYSVIHIYTGKLHCSQNSVNYLIDYSIEPEILFKENNSDQSSEGVEMAPLDNFHEQFYRMDQYIITDDKGNTKKSNVDNYGLYFNIPSIQCFNSTVPSSILDFYPNVGVTRNVASRPDNKYYGLRGFLSVKYCLVERDDVKSFTMMGFKDNLASQQVLNPSGEYRFNFYENENYLPMGYTYTEFMRESEFEKISKNDRHIYLCDYLVVPDDEAEFYAQFMKEVKKTDVGPAKYETYTSAVEERLSGDICSSFDWNSEGFTAKINTKKSNVVFFSVPFDQREMAGIDFGGWSAKVNGVETDVLKVYYGLMAVVVPEGDSVIEFEYSVPGRKIGLIITIASFLIFGVYVWFFRKHKKEQPSYYFFREAFYEDMGYPDDDSDGFSIKSIVNFFKKKPSKVDSASDVDKLDGADIPKANDEIEGDK